MLDRQLKSIIQKPAPEQGALAIDIGLRQLLGFLRRRRKVIVAVPAVVLALALAYVLTATPQYTATAALLIDTQKLSIFSQGDVVSETVITNAGLETQVQILRSGRLAEAVAKKLDLIHNEGFMAESPGFLDTLIGFVTGSSDAPAPAPDEARLTRMATSILRSNLTAMRVGLSFVINVSYTDDDPVLAARIATAYTAAYVDEQLNAQVATAQRGSEWLLSRIDELRNQTTAQNLTAQEKSAIRATYDDFLQRYTQTVQQQSLPLSEARVITTPVRGSQTSPKSLLIVAAALFGGGLIGFLVALVRDLLDQAVRTRKEVEATTRAQFLGYLPKLRTGGWIGRLSGGRRKADTGAQRFRTGPAYSAVIDAPRSQFTETLRNVRLALDKASPPGQGVVCGVVSAVPKEGRSTVAINFARLVAQSGRRVLLIDGDMRSGALSRAMVPAKAPGLVHLANGEVQLADLIWSDDATRLHFLPAGADSNPFDPNEVLTSPAMQALVEACRRQYSLVVVDLPAALPVLDVQAVAHLFDCFLLVAEWGRTSADLLGQAVRLDGVEEKLLGTLLTKVRLGALRRYQDRTTEMIPRKRFLSFGRIA